MDTRRFGDMRDRFLHCIRDTSGNFGGRHKPHRR